jgi:hypothetical protein
MTKLLTISTIIILFNSITLAQSQDTVDLAEKRHLSSHQFAYKKIIAPAFLIGYGIYGLYNNDLQQINLNIRSEVVKSVKRKIHADDYLQFAPAVSVYALNLVGINGQHNLRDRTLILSTSTIIMLGAMLSIKSLSNIERPDGTSLHSFPSGHSSNAFMGAEFLWQEYRNESIWYGIVGYLVASTTGILRMYNNRHWLTDVTMGAGLGILSTKIAYWVYPWIDKKLTKKPHFAAMKFSPVVYDKSVGLAFYMKL